MKVNGKVIVVTGGGSGIGRELVFALLRKGARVAAVDINEKNLAETVDLAGELREKMSTHVVNITDRAAVEALPAAVIAAHGAVDGLVNNAGIIQRFVPFKDLDLPEIERVMNINFYGDIYMTRAFLPHLLKRPVAHIVNVSSMGGFLPVPGQTLYGASKAAVKLFTEGLNSELHDTNVGVTVVFPGAINTNISVNSGLMTKEQQENTKSTYKTTPADVAASAILDGIEGNKYRVLIGSDAKMMDFLYRLMPVRAARIIHNQMKSLLPK
jgi:NAD(P)-dependent dehydrogenase (short-subunit alcohol dehydrogenase family)